MVAKPEIAKIVLVPVVLVQIANAINKNSDFRQDSNFYWLLFFLG